MSYLKVEIFVPEEYVVELANDLNEADILKNGHYDYAFSLTKVEGHWRPLEGADPYDGVIGQVQTREEMKMEFRIDEEDREEVQRIIDRIHPYEVPVVNYIQLV
ncbi:MAG: divalent cation tolerance protein CutA [Aedoeadaptatus pacaensis]|uniref:divalent cation tolerance protein CutA n=1 Tax=Aedoeadaptatus pacaensis TaxID=1776390 RepID=UPI000838EA39|nr:divalent cation tolerance protein CutA [Peptoniphilus pacaensis]